jgi:hypothetical protein
MSADVWLEDANGDQIVVNQDLDAEMRDMIPMRSSAEVTTTSFNLTYNLTPMLAYAEMPAWREFMGMSGSEAGPIWRKVHDRLTADPEGCRALNPPNGWGNYEQAVEVIGALAAACDAYPDAKIGGWL